MTNWVSNVITYWISFSMSHNMITKIYNFLFVLRSILINNKILNTCNMLRKFTLTLELYNIYGFCGYLCYKWKGKQFFVSNLGVYISLWRLRDKSHRFILIMKIQLCLTIFKVLIRFVLNIYCQEQFFDNEWINIRLYFS